MIATVTLNPSIDQHLVVPRFSRDDVSRAVSAVYRPSGKGANVSKVIRELGGPTHAYAFRAGFFGRYWEAELKKLGVASTLQDVPGETRINTTLTGIQDGTEAHISTPGPRISRKTQDLFLRKLLKARPAFWVLSGSPSPGMGEDVYEKYIFALQKTGVTCALDADNAPLLRGIRSRPFLVKPNGHELQRLAGRKLVSLEDYRAAASDLVRQGVKIAAVSLGEKGALFVTDREAFHVAAIPAEVRCRVGAGDALLGGLVLGLFKRWTLEKAAAFGVAAGTSAVLREAPRHCRRGDLPALLKKIRIRRFSR